MKFSDFYSFKEGRGQLPPEERKELHRERRPSDDPNWWQDNRPSNWNPEDED